MQARAWRSGRRSICGPPSSSAPLVTSPNTLANGRPISLPAGWGGGSSPSGNRLPARRVGEMGGRALEDPGTKVTAAYPHTTPTVNRSNRGIAISVNCLNVPAAAGGRNSRTFHAALPHRKPVAGSTRPREIWATHWFRLLLAVSLSARTRPAGWLRGANAFQLAVFFNPPARLDLHLFC